jgi:cobalamin 5'-phosphate synthase/cobalamin synthase
MMRNIRNWISAAVMAVQFLTKFPTCLTPRWNEQLGKRSIVFFPFAGALIGLLLGLTSLVLIRLMPPMPAAACLTLLWIGCTGALHADGWMDTADALGSHRSREQMRAIMKDPRVGAFGVISGVFLILLKFSFLSALWGNTSSQLETVVSGINTAALLATIPVITRTILAWVIVLWPYAGGASGMGAILRLVGIRHGLGASVMGLGCVYGLLILFGVNTYMEILVIISGGWLLAIVGGAVGASWLHRKFGGLSGDTYGAIVEGIELLMLIALVLGLNRMI